MTTQTVIPPDLDDVLNELRNSIFANLNCIQIGKIETVNKSAQTAEIKIQVKRKKGDGTIIDYPLLVDCPVVVMQGGGAFLEFPIKKGDFCLILFNDRNIDTWWDTANITEPPTKRKHSLSDGFALVGINPKTSVLDLSGDKVVLNGGSNDIEIKSDSASNLQSAARITDTSKLTMKVSDVVALATLLLATGAFVPTGTPPVGTTPIVFTDGEITSGSSGVKIG